MTALLMAPALSHRNGPVTEREAAKRIGVRAPAMRKAIAWDFYRAGVIGLSSAEVVKRFSAEPEYSVRPRISEMKSAGLLVPTGGFAVNFRGSRETVLRWGSGDNPDVALARPRSGNDKVSGQ